MDFVWYCLPSFPLLHFSIALDEVFHPRPQNTQIMVRFLKDESLPCIPTFPNNCNKRTQLLLRVNRFCRWFHTVPSLTWNSSSIALHQREPPPKSVQQKGTRAECGLQSLGFHMRRVDSPGNILPYRQDFMAMSQSKYPNSRWSTEAPNGLLDFHVAIQCSSIHY